MSIVKNFLNRKAVSATVKVPFPPDNPEIVFEIARFSEVEKHSAFNIAVAVSRQHPAQAEALFGLEYASGVFKILERHVKGWDKVSDDAPEFSRENLSVLWKSLDSLSGSALVNAYYEACRADEEAHAKNG